MSSRDDVKKAVGSAIESVLARLKSDLVDQVVASIPEPPPPPEETPVDDSVVPEDAETPKEAP